MKRGLKLYVWEEVLTDYKNGMMVALAHNTDEARKLLWEKCSYLPENDLMKEPKEITTPDAFYVWGGG